jgi:hypothetical protein
MKAILMGDSLLRVYEEGKVSSIATFIILHGKLHLESCSCFEDFEEIKKVAYEALDKIKNTKRRDK